MGGGSPRHNSSISRSRETTSPSCSSRSASRARCLRLPSGSVASASTASSGPRILNSTRFIVTACATKLQVISKRAPRSSKRNRSKEGARMHARLGLAAGVVGAAAAVMIAAAAASVTPSPRIADAGALVYCSDMTYPPEESIRRGKPVGSDIDIAASVARQLGVRARFTQVGFDGLLAAVRAKRCDAVISGMTDNAQRRQRVDFADYMALGYSL